jgi:Cu2+-exporting ATPase
MSENCFHCGLPIPAGNAPTAEVLGQRREFCCQGCQAVCIAITDAGLADYYRYREMPAKTADQAAVPTFLNQLELYDRAEIQREFVRSAGDWREASLILEEIRCAACLWLNERHLRSLAGVLDVHMDYTSQRARVRWDHKLIKLSEILKAIAEMGYTAHPYNASHRDLLIVDQKRRSIERLIFAGFIGMAVMHFSIACYLLGQPNAAGEYPLWVVIGRWTGLIATSAILAYSGQEFFVSAWIELKHKRLGMDVPIVLGLSVALIGSVSATMIQSGEVYYDSIVMLVFFLLLARHAELRGRDTAATALDRMTRVVPRTAQRLEASGPKEVPSVDLQVGERVVLRPGERLPVDGEIEAGSSYFNESLLTGEPVPLLKFPGDRVIAGSVNGDQPVTLRVLAAVHDSTVSEIGRLIESALHSRPRYVELAERAVGWLVAVILLIAGTTALAWGSIDANQVIPSVVAVLIVTCPCALALATPVAVSLAAGRFAGHGVLPLRMTALEPLATAKVVMLDKTGTLTLGQPRLRETVSLGKLDIPSCLRIAASLEQQSEHPFAQALRLAAEGSGPLRVTERLNLPGQGVQGKVGDEHWRLGKLEYVSGPDRVKSFPIQIDELQSDGSSVVVLGKVGRPEALFRFMDPPRPGADELISQLKRLGVEKVMILSGDHPLSVSYLANSLGIEEYYGNLSPGDKLDKIKALQRSGQRVIMIGDGINDVPTLAAADASLSFADASELAQVHSDFIIVSHHLPQLAKVRELARQTRRIIFQNLGWAVAYNVCAVPLAALGIIPPWGAAIGMSLSSLIVVANSMRLLRNTAEEKRLTTQRESNTGLAPMVAQK